MVRIMGMNLPDLVFRCYREINHSKTAEMLEVAHNYYSLFLKLLSRNNVNKGVIDNLTTTFSKAYNRRYKILNP